MKRLCRVPHKQTYRGCDRPLSASRRSRLIVDREHIKPGSGSDGLEIKESWGRRSQGPGGVQRTIHKAEAKRGPDQESGGGGGGAEC